MNLNNLKLGFDKVYVISLPRRLDRRERVNRVLNGIDFEFVDSIDGYKDIDIKELIKRKLELNLQKNLPFEIGLVEKVPKEKRKAG